MKSKLIIVAGKNPFVGLGGGHNAYVHMWSYASIQAGYRPDIFSISHDATETDSYIGKVHNVRSPLFWVSDKHRKGFATNTAMFHVNSLAKKIVAFAQKHPHSSYVVHGFGLWGAVAVQSALSLRKAGIKCKAIITAYTTVRHEYESKWSSITNQHGFRAMLRSGWEMFALKMSLDRREKNGYLKSDLVLVNYDSVRRILEGQWGPHPDVRKVPYSTLGELLPQKHHSEEAIPEIISSLQNQDAPLLMTVSRHDPRKGLDTFIRSLALLKEKGIRFRACIPGTGHLIEFHAKLARILNLQNNLVFTGFVDEITPYLKQADVFVLPSYEEGSGSVSMLEAMQHGKAIVASRIDGIPEDITDRESGLLVQPKDKQALAGRLEELIRDPDLRSQLGSNAKSVFESRFSRNVIVRAACDLYDGLRM
jgi:glycosyltransferase involved in cell wall biosynthesis